MVRQPRGVTTTEYALILGVVAILMYGTYLALGSSVGSLANRFHADYGSPRGGSGAVDANGKHMNSFADMSKNDDDQTSSAENCQVPAD